MFDEQQFEYFAKGTCLDCNVDTENHNQRSDNLLSTPEVTCHKCGKELEVCWWESYNKNNELSGSSIIVNHLLEDGIYI